MSMQIGFCQDHAGTAAASLRFILDTGTNNSARHLPDHGKPGMDCGPGGRRVEVQPEAQTADAGCSPLGQQRIISTRIFNLNHLSEFGIVFDERLWGADFPSVQQMPQLQRIHGGFGLEMIVRDHVG
jgi:hypothetical protein